MGGVRRHPVVVGPRVRLVAGADERQVLDARDVIGVRAVQEAAGEGLLVQALELEMRAANIRLAQAIEAEHGYGPQVTKAIDETHEVMGDLQKETLQHLFAMRAVLNPQQASIFDRTVVKALTAEAHPSSER